MKIFARSALALLAPGAWLLAAAVSASAQSTLTVQVFNGGSNTPFAGVAVALVAFDAQGEPDPALTQLLVTEASGSTSTVVLNNRDYQIALATAGYGPTIRDQVMDPYGNFRVKTSVNATKTFTLYPAPPGFFHTMTVAVSSLSAVGQLLVSDVFINNQNREPMAFAIGRATDTAGASLQVFNVPQLNAGSYGLRVSEPGRGRAVETIQGVHFPANSAFAVDLTSALPPSKFEDVTSTSAASVEGVIRSTAGAAVPGMRVNLIQFLDNTPNPNCGGCILPTFLADSFTDGNGRFRFFDVPASSVPYNLYASRLGFFGLFTSVLRSSPTTPTIRLPTFVVFAATYSLTGVVRYGGAVMPAGDIFSHGDFDTWSGADGYAGGFKGSNHDGRIKVAGDGSFALEGIPDGNVDLNVNFQGGNYWFNAGANGQRDNSGNARGGDDRRVTVTSTTVADCPSAGPSCPAGTTIVYDAAGAIVSTGPVVFDVQPPAGANVGVITGSVTFITTFTVSAASPLVIASSRPVAILATSEFQAGQSQRIGVATIAGTLTQRTTTYSISVATGSQYHTTVFSADWAKATDFNDSADLEASTGPVVLNYDLVRAGRMLGQVRLPDGSNYRPVFAPESSPIGHFIFVEARGVTSDGRGFAAVDEFGGFELPNLAPGVYRVEVVVRGEAAAWPSQVINDVVVYEGKTTNLAVKLKDALYVQPQIFGLPDLTTDTWRFKVVAFPAGFKLNQSGLALNFIDSDASRRLFNSVYSTTTQTWDSIRMEAGAFDFYLLLEQNYNPEPPSDPSDYPQSFYQFENFIGQLKSVAVQRSEANPDLGTQDQPIPVGILGSVGQATVEGTAVGSKLFTPNDLQRVFANFREIFLLLPAVILYDATGDLKGYSAGLPSAAGLQVLLPALLNKDAAAFLAAVAAHPLRYRISGLPPGKYTAVFMNPNYPPVVRDLELPSGTRVLNFDFDSQQVLAGTLRGVVVSSATGQGIPDAVVSIRHRSLERIRRTDDQGRFRVENLPTGVYRVEATKGGFTSAGDKVALSAGGTLSVNLTLFATTSSIRGIVFLRKFPTPAVKDGVKVVAYDETANVDNPEAYLPRLTAFTDDDGRYELPGVLPGHLYKVTALTPGKLIESLFVDAQPGVTVADEIVLRDSPPELLLIVRKSLEQVGKVDLFVKSPKELRDPPTGTYNPGPSFDAGSAVNLTFIRGPENSFLGRFTPSPTQRTYAIRVTAGETGNQLEKTFVFDQFSDARSEQFVHESAVAGGDVAIDEEKEDFSGLELDAGSLTAISTGTVSDFSNLIGGFFSSLPSVRMVKTDRGTAETVGSLLEGLLASEVYEIDLSSAQQNKSLTLTLKYDKALVTDTGSLRIRQYNATAGEWEEVPGNYTVDPLTGVVSVEVESIAAASAGSSAAAPLARRRIGRAAVSGGRFVPSQTTATSQSGQFAVFSAAPPTGVAYAGEKFEIYNLPNPFDLKTKTIALSSDKGAAFAGPTTDVRGTLIKYHLPAGKTGAVKLLIYNLAGERVREIDEGSRTGGFIYYSEWDGRNDDGQDCASGVYFLLTQVDGKKVGRKAHKLALVK